jgi:tetratricopeptide (TPR) repeat protein
MERKPYEAMAAYEEGWKLDRRQVWMGRNIGEIHFELGDHARAAEYFQEVISQNPNRGWLDDVYVKLALSLEELGRPGEAARTLAQAIASDPADGSAHRSFIELVRRYKESALEGGRSRDLEALAAQLEAALGPEGGDPLLLRTLAFIRLHAAVPLSETGDVKKARVEIERAVAATGRGDPESLAILAEA